MEILVNVMVGQDRLDLAVLLEVLRANILHEKFVSALLDILENTKEPPLCDEVRLILLHYFQGDTHQLHQITVLKLFEVIRKYVDQTKSVILSDVFLDVHVHSLVSCKQQITQHGTVIRTVFHVGQCQKVNNPAFVLLKQNAGLLIDGHEDGNAANIRSHVLLEGCVSELKICLDLASEIFFFTIFIEQQPDNLSGGFLYFGKELLPVGLIELKLQTCRLYL